MGRMPHSLITRLKLAAVFLMLFSLSACSFHSTAVPTPVPSQTPSQISSKDLVVIEDEPDTVDFQCTSIHYTIAQNVFDRLVEMDLSEEGIITVMPSLASSWELSDEGRVYTFHLRDHVTFSNGSPLTSSDVLYTLTRLLTHPDSCNQDIAESIDGALELESGASDHLEGFQILDDLTFTITLEKPFAAFLACMSMPGASILDEESTVAAGDRFGLDSVSTVGTGSFVLDRWEAGKGMHLAANKDCWKGAPKCDGVELLFLTDSEDIRSMFEKGELDILNLDDLDNSEEFFMHGDIYQDRLIQVQQVGISYIALNESISPLNDVRVRRALQLALNRNVLLEAVYSNRGLLENGIFPHGLYGFNPDLPEIPYDPEEAKALLSEAGYSKGFSLTVALSSASTQKVRTLLKQAASMWEKIGVRATIKTMDDGEFMRLRKRGEIACYTATWTADYNDPDNFIYTFFGTHANTLYRSLCYPYEQIRQRVRKARTIINPDERIKEYQNLEKIIIQDDAAWIPLFSRMRYYVISERLKGFRASWNGSVKNNYREMSVT